MAGCAHNNLIHLKLSKEMGRDRNDQNNLKLRKEMGRGHNNCNHLKLKERRDSITMIEIT